jgi:hypothetical protein
MIVMKTTTMMSLLEKEDEEVAAISAHSIRANRFKACRLRDDTVKLGGLWKTGVLLSKGSNWTPADTLP